MAVLSAIIIDAAGLSFAVYFAIGSKHEHARCSVALLNVTRIAAEQAFEDGTYEFFM